MTTSTVNSQFQKASSAGVYLPGEINNLGMQLVADFYLQMAMEGNVFQVRAGSISGPLVGDVVITDTAAEMATSAIAGTTIIPVSLDISINLGTGTLHEYGAKSVGAVHTVGTEFAALPLKIGGSAAAGTFSTVSAAGGVAVAAEVVTTTRQHWSYANPVVAGAGNDPGTAAIASNAWAPRVPPILVGPACWYVQIAATGTGPSYFAHYDFIVLDSDDIG